MSDIVQRLKDFLNNKTDDLEFRITVKDVQGLGRGGVEAINDIIERERRREGAAGFTVEPARIPGDDIVISKDPAMNSPKHPTYKPRDVNNLYEGGETDGRVASINNAEEGNPFRPRYRKLAQNELDHHDKIKLQAMELLSTFREIPVVRTTAGNESTGEEHANIKLAQRHLEDAVYRAVKALTA